MLNQSNSNGAMCKIASGEIEGSPDPDMKDIEDQKEGEMHIPASIGQNLSVNELKIYFERLKECDTINDS